MRFFSTAGQAPWVGLEEAVWRGLAPDGGLYLPATVPRLPDAFWAALPALSLGDLAVGMLEPFGAGEISASELDTLLHEALDFPIPLVRLEERIWLLELFHGPTLAFKDVGARVMARLLARRGRRQGEMATVIVATSGDTGGAVASAFYGVPGTRVVVLYPRGQVSPRQERQMATLGENILALAVDGSFDDCQRLAKRALSDRELTRRLGLTSANSINVGRLLPQMVTYAHALAQLPEGLARERVAFVTPSGNFGNLTAGLLAWRMGLPCHHFVAATNANRVVPEYLASGELRPRPSIRTMANAMDVGDPSNLERIRSLFADDLAAMRRVISTSSHDDREIADQIRQSWAAHGVALDPHTAVGVRAARQELVAQGHQLEAIVVLSTAHPAKFAEVVEPLIGASLPLPEALARALERALLSELMPPDEMALRRRLLAWGG